MVPRRANRQRGKGRERIRREEREMATEVGKQSARVWVRCGPRSTDSSPELCPGRSRKIYNTDVFLRCLALRLVRLFSSSTAGRTKGGQEDEDGTAQRWGVGEPKPPSITRETKRLGN